MKEKIDSSLPNFSTYLMNQVDRGRNRYIQMSIALDHPEHQTQLSLLQMVENAMIEPGSSAEGAMAIW